MSLSVEAKTELIRLASQDLFRDIQETRARLKKLEQFIATPGGYISHLRDGTGPICPLGVSQELREYLGIAYGDSHFRIRADPGNRGVRLEVSIVGCSWDNVSDPWPEVANV